jgi:hypothetical protein
MRIASAANVLTPAYLTIVAKGYAVRSEGDLLVATKGDDTFIAEDPILLLGVIAVGECRGEDWQATDAQIDDFLSAFG